MTPATCPVRYAGAFDVDAAAVPYVAWPIMSLPTSTTACRGDNGGKKPADLALLPSSSAPRQGCYLFEPSVPYR